MSTTLDEKSHQETPPKCQPKKTPKIFNEKKICEQICEQNDLDLLSKPMDWFLYDRDICHERVITQKRDIFRPC